MLKSHFPLEWRGLGHFMQFLLHMRGDVFLLGFPKLIHSYYSNKKILPIALMPISGPKGLWHGLVMADVIWMWLLSQL